jgi:metacaspase-1
VGINYFGTSNALKGCINDVRNIAPFLNQRYRFAYDDMVILTDDQTNPASKPTRENIIRAMRWLVQGAQPNDSLFFHFSGHGGQTEDLDGDEEDGLDETIYPVDFKQAGMIVDDVRPFSLPLYVGLMVGNA